MDRRTRKPERTQHRHCSTAGGTPTFSLFLLRPESLQPHGSAGPHAPCRRKRGDFQWLPSLHPQRGPCFRFTSCVFTYLFGVLVVQPVGTSPATIDAVHNFQQRSATPLYQIHWLSLRTRRVVGFGFGKLYWLNVRSAHGFRTV